MREMQQLTAEQRNRTGKGPAYQARLKGMIPAIIYGGGSDPEPVSVEQRTLERFAESGLFLTTLFELNIDGAKTRVIPRDVQLDPVTDRVVHVDFMRLPKGAKVRLAIPVRFKNQDISPGLKRGGVLNIVRHDVEMLCPADNIPDSLEADLGSMEIHGTLHINDFKLPEGVSPVIRDRNFTIASIVAPSGMKEDKSASTEASAEAAPAAGKAAAAGKAPAGKAPAKADKK